MSAIQWYNNPKFDAPELGSPQPCIHGAGCVFTVKNAEGVVVPGCCRYVHPGEEGNGRRLFPESVINGQHKNACVRLTGKAGFYERCRLRLPWQEWCARNNIPYTPNKAGERHAPVKRVPIGYKAPPEMEVIKGATDMLVKRLASSNLADADKAEHTVAVEQAVESLQKVYKAVGEPVVARVYRLEASEKAAIAEKIAADPAAAADIAAVKAAQDAEAVEAVEA